MGVGGKVDIYIIYPCNLKMNKGVARSHKLILHSNILSSFCPWMQDLHLDSVVDRVPDPGFSAGFGS